MPDNHSWTVQSRHRTSEGTVTYLRCSCGEFRILAGGRTDEIEIAAAAGPAAALTG